MTTDEKFLLYEKLLREWNERMNLVAPSTLCDIRNRHINDSLQLVEHLSCDVKIFDLGSGAGFPAVVLAVLGLDVTAIESISKKCAFLNELKSQLDLPNFKVINERIENIFTRKMENKKRIAITARAFAALSKILDMTYFINAEYVLLKGESAPKEIAIAKENYNFDYKLIPSNTGPGYILIINNVKRRKK